MKETQEQVDVLLEAFGEPLKFTYGTVLGIPEQSVYSVQGLSSIYDIQKQDFSFNISYKDFYIYSLKEKDTFIYTLGSTYFIFEIISYSHDLLNWTSLKVNLIEIDNV